MIGFSQLNRAYERAQESEYERREYEADRADWLASMTEEERRDYETRVEESQGF